MKISSSSYLIIIVLAPQQFGHLLQLLQVSAKLGQQIRCCLYIWSLDDSIWYTGIVYADFLGELIGVMADLISKIASVFLCKELLLLLTLSLQSVQPSCLSLYFLVAANFLDSSLYFLFLHGLRIFSELIKYHLQYKHFLYSSLFDFA